MKRNIALLALAPSAAFAQAGGPVAGGGGERCARLAGSLRIVFQAFTAPIATAGTP